MPSLAYFQVGQPPEVALAALAFDVEELGSENPLTAVTKKTPKPREGVGTAPSVRSPVKLPPMFHRQKSKSSTDQFSQYQQHVHVLLSQQPYPAAGWLQQSPPRLGVPGPRPLGPRPAAPPLAPAVPREGMAASAWIRESDCKDVRIKEGPGLEGGTRWPTEAAEPAAVEPSGSAGAGEAASGSQSSAGPHPADVDVDVGALVGEKTKEDVEAEGKVKDHGCHHGWPICFRYKRCDGWCDRVTTEFMCVRPCNEHLDPLLDHHPGPHLCRRCAAGFGIATGECRESRLGIEPDVFRKVRRLSPP